jgi:hypothetical protein
MFEATSRARVLDGDVELAGRQDLDADFITHSKLGPVPIEVLVAPRIQATQADMDLVAYPTRDVGLVARSLIRITAHPREGLAQNAK